MTLSMGEMIVTTSGKHIYLDLDFGLTIFLFRLSVVKEAEKQFKAGKFPSEFFAPDTPEQWFKRMKGKDEFADAVFFQLAAFKLKRDIIFLHVNQDTVQNGAFSWLKGGPLLSETSAVDKCPLFLGKNILEFVFKFN